MQNIFKIRLLAVLIFLLGAGFAYFNSAQFLNADGLFGDFVYRLGLDLQGGTHLVYRADVSSIESGEVSEAMAGLRDVIERRVNFFGVTEPVVQIQKSGNNWRLIVELAGVFDVNQAIELIGATPYLEFKTELPEETTSRILQAQEQGQMLRQDPYFAPTKLTGRYLKKAILDFSQQTSEPIVVLEFNDEGKELFANLTKDNIGKRIAIYLDGAPISAPVVQEEIKAGRAQITGQFTPEEAKELVRNLNSGALPIPITLISQQTVGPSLGAQALDKGIFAGAVGIGAVFLFILLWYRLPGFIGILAMAFYTAFVLFLYKFFVTLTAAGIAGFILSVGMAVDANILIFERMKEEACGGKEIYIAMREGFARAWPSIRDANISTLITSSILYWFGTSIVKGFALTLGIGVLASVFSAVIVSRTFLLFIRPRSDSNIVRFLFGTGLSRL